uniref:DNA polymerase delta 4, accessory subunit n=2 Tax=Paramormyrops kingsleyae TaxID=1676925 RepID=A0A3B3T190_9TELE
MNIIPSVSVFLSTAMSPKRRLITDSFKVVKRTRTSDKRGKSPVPEQEAEPDPLTPREKDLLQLRKFDLDWRYGPCTGISRIQRWERAQLHGLTPPADVRELLLKGDDDPDYSHCLWRDYPL